MEITEVPADIFPPVYTHVNYYTYENILILLSACASESNTSHPERETSFRGYNKQLKGEHMILIGNLNEIGNNVIH